MSATGSSTAIVTHAAPLTALLIPLEAFDVSVHSVQYNLATKIAIHALRILK